jgi:hypothetical protein
MAEIWLGLLAFWTLLLAGFLIYRNPHSYEEVRRAEQNENGPWPKE